MHGMVWEESFAIWFHLSNENIVLKLFGFNGVSTPYPGKFNSGTRTRVHTGTQFNQTFLVWSHYPHLYTPVTVPVNHITSKCTSNCTRYQYLYYVVVGWIHLYVWYVIT